jgi:TolB-like protein/DNA-binding SARP family transcriptional activator
VSASPARPFVLRLFGSPSIATAEGAAITGPPVQRHRIALLALLALSPRRTSTRERAMGLLWPESPAEQGRQLLKQAVYHVRKALGDDAIVSAGEDMVLNTDIVGADVLDFESALERADHATGVTLYQGPLLEGFFLSDAPEFERWVDRERERLAGAYARALEALAEAAERERDLAGAVKWWKARAAHDPYDSRVALRLMLALDASGNRGGALQHAALHQRLLSEDLEATMPSEVQALAERLRREPAPTAPPNQRPAIPPALPTFTVAAADVPPAPVSVAPTPTAPPRPRTTGRYIAAALLLSAVAVAVIQWGARRSPGAAPTPAPTIAVLPLTNLDADRETAALTDGMTEELIALLARTDGLRVIARTSVFAFRDRQIDVRRIADSLGADHILEGGLQKSGTRLRVRIRLVDARDGSTRWSQTYDRELHDVFAVQDEIARDVSRELGLRFARAEGASRRRQRTTNVAAYELYLRGSDRTLLRGDSAAREGVSYLRQAIALDSTYAAAHAALARMYARLSAGTDTADRARYGALSEQTARKAVSLDDSLAEGHAVLGVRRMAAFDFEAAERHLMRAIELDPGMALIHEWLVTLYVWKGRPNEALAHAERALELEPLSPTAHAERARALLFDDRCEEALAHLAKLASVRPPLLRAPPIAAQCHAQAGNWPAAIAALRPQAERGERTALALLGYMLARGGERDEARRIGASFLERWRRGEGVAFELALVHAGLADFDEAFLWLDRSLVDRSLVGGPGNPGHLMIISPLMDDLRRDSRFEHLRQRLGLQKR